MATDDPRQVKGFQSLEEIGNTALGDPAYRRRLIADPKSVLSENGVQVPNDVEVVVHVNTPNLIHLVLPSAPRPSDLLDPEETNLVPLMSHHMF